MPNEVKLPRLGQGMESGTIIKWLKSEGDATVQSVAKVSVGSVMQSGQHFLTLVPADAPLEIEANIFGHDNGFVHVGDPVSIKFDTFPYSQYGMAEGSVRVTVRVGPNGEVTSASPSASTLSGKMVGCLTGKLRSAQFAAPPSGGATLVVPLGFHRQK